MDYRRQPLLLQYVLAWSTVEPMLNPLKQIPENLRQEYLDRLTLVVKNRTAIFCMMVAGLFIIAYGSAYFLSPVDVANSELAMVGILIGGSALIYYLSRAVKTIATAKWNSFISIVFLLSILVLGTMKRPTSFNYSPYILTLFFTALMIPWFVRDVLLIIGLHFAAFYAYCSTRDFSGVSIPETLFGSDPFLNGAVFIGFAAVMCVAVRLSENKLHIKNYLLLKDVEAKKAQMERELEFASRVQDSLVPHSFESSIADVFVTYRPMESIGGDYANFQRVDDEHLIFFIGDVTGHGVPAALMVNRLHTEFDQLAETRKQPGAIMRDLNQFIVKAFSGTSMYLTAFCGMVDFKDQKIYYSNYGHPPQYIYKLHDTAVTSLEAQTSLLGLDLGEGEQVYESQIDYREGDMVFLFTDGILELKNQAGEEYGAQRLQKFIQNHSAITPQEIYGQLMKDLSAFGSGSFKDDVFIISIKCKSGAYAKSK